MKIKKIAVLALVFTLAGCVDSVSSVINDNSLIDSIASVDSTDSTHISEVPTIVPKYTISFFTNGGGNIPEIREEAGTLISEPSNPVIQGKIFIGWFEDYLTYQTRFVFTTMPARNLVLYANYEELSDTDILEYRDYLSSISQPNHLYIHYRRFNNAVSEYSQWDVWAWPENRTGRMFDFASRDNALYTDEYGGAMTDIDLALIYNDGGHDGLGNHSTEEVNFFTDEQLVSKIGFLITFKASRSSGSHWTSDGGDKFLITSEALKYGPNGSLHIFAVQDNVVNFTYKYGGEIYANPYENDDGTNVSAKYKDVDSSGTPMDIAPTSNDLYNLGVGYQVMVSSFADSDGDGMGDILGITDNLAYLKSLNIEVLWLTPIQLSDSYHGYDVIDYKVVDPKFGSRNSRHVTNNVTSITALLDYLDLIAEADALGMKVIMDLVVNHTSINNTLFQQAIALDPDYRAYYHWKNHVTNPEVAANEFWHQYSTYNYSYYGKFATNMPELNYDYQATRDVMVDIMKYWVDWGVSGFRIDAVKHIYLKEEIEPDNNDVLISDTGSSVDYTSNLTKNLHFFRELNARLKEYEPNAFIVGENFDGHAFRVAPYYEGLDSMLNFYMYYNLTQSVALGDQKPTYRKAAKISGAYVPTGGDLFVPNNPSQTGDDKVGVKYGGSWNYPGVNEVFNKYRSNNGAIETSAVDGLFTSNHDLVRPVNKVLGTTTEAGEINNRGTVTSANSAKANSLALTANAAAILLPGLSWIYYGDEIGLSANLPSGVGELDPSIDRFERQPFKWSDNSSYNVSYSFTGDKTYWIEWDTYNASTLVGANDQTNDSTSMLSYTKQLTALKSSYQAFKTGSYTPINLSRYGGETNPSAFNVFAFSRSGEDGTFEVYINMSNQTLPLTGVSGGVELSIKGATTSSLPAWSILVVSK